jgi:hypothetical protein
MGFDLRRVTQIKTIMNKNPSIISSGIGPLYPNSRGTLNSKLETLARYQNWEIVEKEVKRLQKFGIFWSQIISKAVIGNQLENVENLIKYSEKDEGFGKSYRIRDNCRPLDKPHNEWDALLSLATKTSKEMTELILRLANDRNKNPILIDNNSIKFGNCTYCYKREE